MTRRCRRIAIVGCSGGGKSTLARALGARLGLPVVHMDTLFWLPGWTESDREVFRAKVDEAASEDRWVMDGGFITHSRARFQRADTVVWIELPIWRCLARAMWRMLTNFGRTRADLAPDCPERFDLAFYRYIWNWDRDSRATDAGGDRGLGAGRPAHPLEKRCRHAAVRRRSVRPDLSGSIVCQVWRGTKTRLRSLPSRLGALAVATLEGFHMIARLLAAGAAIGAGRRPRARLRPR